MKKQIPLFIQDRSGFWDQSMLEFNTMNNRMILIFTLTIFNNQLGFIFLTFYFFVTHYKIFNLYQGPKSILFGM
jgi:hypothetical protein